MNIEQPIYPLPPITVISEEERERQITRPNGNLVHLSRQIEAEITALCQPYRQPNIPYHNFWTISPGYSALSAERAWVIQDQVNTLVSLYDLINRQFGSPLAQFGVEIRQDRPFYIRLDTMSLTNPLQGVTSAEISMVPVGEGEVSAMRQIYDELIAGRSLNQFPGSINSTYELLRTNYPNRAIRAVVSPQRAHYRGDYVYVAQECRNRGLDFEMEDLSNIREVGGRLEGMHGPIDLIYRGFQLSDFLDLNQFPDPEMYTRHINNGDLEFYPQMTHWESKLMLTRLGNLNGIFPQTWFLDDSTRFLSSRDWRLRGLVLKPINGRESRGLTFSRKVSNRQWEEVINNNIPGGNHIVQVDRDPDLERFRALSFDRDQGLMVDQNGYRDRMCINVFVDRPGETGVRQSVIGDIDHTLRRGTRLVHTASDAVHVPMVIC